MFNIGEHLQSSHLLFISSYAKQQNNLSQSHSQDQMLFDEKRLCPRPRVKKK